MWERVNCTSSYTLENLCHSCLYEQPNIQYIYIYIYVLFFHPCFRFLFLYPHLFYFIYFLGSGKSLINQDFMQEQISNRLNLGHACSHSA